MVINYNPRSPRRAARRRAHQSVGAALYVGRGQLLVGVCAAAVIAAASPASAAAFTAGNQTELNNAIAAANASSDPSSTITLTSSFSLTTAPTAITSNVTINTGSNTLTLASGQPFNVGDGVKLSISGNVLGSGVLNTGLLNKTGDGDLEINGVTASSVTQIGVHGGTMLIDGGSTIGFNTTTGGTTPKMSIGRSAGDTATLTIAGTGTVVTSGAGTDPIVIGGGTSGTLNVEDGGVLNVLTSSLETYDNGTINATGAGSAIHAFGISEASGTGSINITDGGLISTSGVATFGGVGLITQNAKVNGVVSGTGSEFIVGTTLYLQRGTLAVLDGGHVTANTISEATATAGSTPSGFDTLVSGTGSELDAATAFTLGTRGPATLTIADGGKVAVNSGAGTLIMGSTNANSAAVLNIGGAMGEAAAAAGTLDATSITLAASAEINFNHTNNGYVFDPTINGSGAINQVAGHTIFADQSGFTGLTTITGGVLEANGTLGGTVDVIGGMLSGTGTVGATTNEAGGTISPGGDGIGTLTIAGDYTGNGGTLDIQSVLGDDTSATDLLAVTGSTGGTTTLAVTNAGGAGAQTTDGIKVVDVTGASDGTFTLKGDYLFDGDQAVVGGAYAYRLYQGGISDPTDGDWYLRSDLIPTAPSGPSTPLYQPGVPLYEAYANVLQSFNQLPTLEQRVGQRSWSDGSPDGTAEGTGTWGRIEGSRQSFADGTSTTGVSHTDNIWRLQGGADVRLADLADGGLIGGISVQYGTITSDMSSPFGAGTISGSGAGAGASLTWYGRSGFYLDAQAQALWYDSTLGSTTASRTLIGGNNALGYALSLEGGQRIGLNSNWSITPQAQLSYSAIDANGFTDSFGAAVSPDLAKSLKGRLGLSADFDQGGDDSDDTKSHTHTYGIANLNYDFGGATTTSVAGVAFSNKADPLWGGVGLGGTYSWANDKYALHGEASVNTSLDHFGQSYGIGATGGFTVKW